MNIDELLTEEETTCTLTPLKYRKILVLTGSGISAPSGIPTFRTDGGLWERERIEEICTIQALNKDPERVFHFYKKLRDKYRDAVPNAAHVALAKLEKAYDKSKYHIWTQNVDMLHEQAGSQNVVHMHGTLDVLNTNTKQLQPYDTTEAYQPWLRPNVVLFGEDVKLSSSQIITGAKCDLFLSIGTSDNVWPANGLHKYLPKMCHKVQFNLTKTLYSGIFDEVILGDCSVTLPEYVEKLLLAGEHRS